MWPRRLTVMRIYYRYERTGIMGLGYNLEALSKSATQIRYWDRTLLLVWRPEEYPRESDWEGYVDLSPFDADTAASGRLSHVLFSAHNAGQKTVAREMSKARIGSTPMDRSTYMRSGVEIIGDSGGAQLMTGTTSYVDPHKVIEFFNKGVDVGIALDIPPRAGDNHHPEIIRALAACQAKNNVVFNEHREEGLRLLNSVHGYTTEQVRDWIARVSEPIGGAWDGWAIGSAGFNDMVVTRNILTTILEAPWPKVTVKEKIPKKERTNDGPKYRDVEREYKHLHVFAVSGINRIPGVAWISKYVDLLTLDSNLWLQGVTYNRYLLMTPNGQMNTFRFGREGARQQYINAKERPQPSGPMCCNCPVCGLFPAWDVFNEPTKYGLYIPLAWHNVFTIQRYIQMWSEMAAEMDLEAFEWEMGYSLGWTAKALNFVDMCMNEGIDAASADHLLDLALNETHGTGTKHMLFGGTDSKTGQLIDPNDPMTQLGSSNVFDWYSKPSTLATNIPNYLTPEEITAFGLKVYPPTKDRKTRTKSISRKEMIKLAKVHGFLEESFTIEDSHPENLKRESMVSIAKQFGFDKKKFTLADRHPSNLDKDAMLAEIKRRKLHKTKVTVSERDATTKEIVEFTFTLEDAPGLPLLRKGFLKMIKEAEGKQAKAVIAALSEKNVSFVFRDAPNTRVMGKVFLRELREEGGPEAVDDVRTSRRLLKTFTFIFNEAPNTRVMRKAFVLGTKGIRDAKTMRRANRKRKKKNYGGKLR